MTDREFGNLFEDALGVIYSKLGKQDYLSDDLLYLHNAFLRVEDIWEENYRKVKVPQMILLGEAPLYGEGESYFYSLSSGATEFFNYKNAEDLIGPIDSERKKNLKNVRPAKEEMLTKLAEIGLVIIEVFPYCFKEGTTRVTYPEIAKHKGMYGELFDHAYEVVLQKKLLKIFALNPNVKIGFRYRRTQDEVGQLLAQKLIRDVGYSSSTIPSYNIGRGLNSKLMANQLGLSPRSSS